MSFFCIYQNIFVNLHKILQFITMEREFILINIIGFDKPGVMCRISVNRTCIISLI